ncbi:hypothetical protein KKD61_04060 [Patescibacteria group bacterium]|nr:hypothetical protein [Patescibacteria group bacterium]
MKKQIVGKILTLVFVLAAAGIAFYLYKEGKISFLPDKTTNSSNNQEEIVSFPFTEKEYNLSYADKVKHRSLDIADFEENEKWTGDSDFDYTYFITGKSGLSFVSRNYERSSASIDLVDRFNFNNFSSYKIFVYLFSGPSNIEEFKVILSDGKKNHIYSVRGLSEGWNLVVMPKDKFFYESNDDLNQDSPDGPISEIRIELVSRAKTMASLTVDSLWAEKEVKYPEDWSVLNEESLALKNFSGTENLLFAGMRERLVASIKKITSAQDYTFSAKFTPLTKGEFGLFARGNYRKGFGYYLTLSGLDESGWQIRKIGIFDKNKGVENITLTRGTIDNVKIERGTPYWLKAELSGRIISFSVSLDGVNFSKLGEANDGSFTRGGVGVTVFSAPAVLVDDLRFFQ